MREKIRYQADRLKRLTRRNYFSNFEGSICTGDECIFRYRSLECSTAMSYTYLYLLGMSHGIFLSLCLWVKKGKAGRFLAVLGLVISFELFVEYRLMGSGFRRNQSLYYAREAVGFLYGPLLFYYVSAITDSLQKLRFKSLVHLLPLTAYAIFEFGVIAKGFLSPGIALTAQISAGHIKSLQIIAYVISAFAELMIYRRRIRDFFSNTGRIGLTWLMIVLSAVFCIVVLGEIGVILRQLGFPFAKSIIVIHFLLIAIAVYGVSYLTFFKPDIYNLIHCMHNMTDADESADDAEKTKYEKSVVSAPDREKYLSILRVLFEKEEIFLDPDITIGQVSERMKISVNVLSQVINTMTGKNFFTFVNDYRIGYAEQMLSENGEDINILSVAFRSGFNSKSAFYSVFRKKHGISPLEFRNAHVKTSS